MAVTSMRSSFSRCCLFKLIKPKRSSPIITFFIKAIVCYSNTVTVTVKAIMTGLFEPLGISV